MAKKSIEFEEKISKLNLYYFERGRRNNKKKINTICPINIVQVFLKATFQKRILLTITKNKSNFFLHSSLQ